MQLVLSVFLQNKHGFYQSILFMFTMVHISLSFVFLWIAGSISAYRINYGRVLIAVVGCQHCGPGQVELKIEIN